MNNVRSIVSSLILLLVLSNFSYSQVIGGRENGEMTPTAAKPAQLSGGSLKGDVNPMTGEFSSSIALGTVGTPGGLSYSLSLDYTSSFSISASQAMTAGIPYGDGWGPNLPSISVEVDAFHKFQCSDFNYQSNDPDVIFNNSTDEFQGRDEGDLYWFAPIINIPGVASGRAVFKYIDEADDKCLVFVLNKFETPVEVRFYGVKGWEVRVANGNTYTFRSHLKSYTAPDAQRILHYDQSNLNSNNQQEGVVINSDNSPLSPYGVYSDAVQNIIEPKESFTVWYCDQIFNLNLPKQSIHFDYNYYGAFNYFQEFNQTFYETVRLDIFGDDVNTDYTVYSDIHLAKVYSLVDASAVDIVELNYNTLKQDMDGGIIVDGNAILDKDDNNVTVIDALYNSKIVHSWGSGNDSFTSWKRYNHAAVQPYTLSATSVNNTNPYLHNSQSPLKYDTDPISSSNEAAFDHGFLESERLFQSGMGYYPGDIYEVKTTVTRNSGQSLRNGNGTIDIAIKSGVNGNYPGNETQSSYAGFINNPLVSDYEAQKGLEIFSTFNSPVKWQMGYGQGSVNTSNFFVMPNIPSKYFGFNIQVGPGNSDIDFGTESTNCTDLNKNGNIDARAAYPYAWSNGRLIRSTDRIPHNFGTGHPWAMMIPIYNEMALNRSNGISGSSAPPSDLFDAWWATPYAQGLGETNIPTKFDDDVKLTDVQLVRYSKNALMLESVVVYKVNGEYKGLQDDTKSGWHVVSQKKLDYKVKNETLLRNYDYSNNDELVNELLQRKVILLARISDVPLNGDLTLTDFGLTDPTQVLTTTLGYDKYLDENSYTTPTYLNTTGEVPYIQGLNQYLLTSYVDALGGITRVEYYPVSDPATRKQSLYKYSNCAYSGQARVTEAFGRDHAYTVHAAARFLSKNDEGDQLLSSSNVLTGGNVDPNLKVWEYVYTTSNVMTNPKKLNLPVEYFSGHYFMGDESAFKNVRVYEPFVDANATGRNYTDYEYYGNVVSDPTLTKEEYLFYGKPKHIKRYSYNDVLEEETIFDYDYTLAFENGYLRPNPLRSHLWNESPIIREYEYEDIQQNQTLYIGGVPKPAAYPSLDVPYLNGNYTSREMPKLLSFWFFDEMVALNDTTLLNSYFIKKTAETHRTYEDGLIKGANVNPPVITVTSMPQNNPFGSGYINEVEDDSRTDDPLIATIDPEDEEAMLDALSAASPLSDAVLTSLVTSEVSASAKYTILILQGDLSNAIWSDIWSNISSLSSSDVETLGENQSYISDQVLLDMLAVTTESSNASMVTALGKANAYLSGQVINAMKLNTQEMPGSSFEDILTGQPQLPESDLISIIGCNKANSSNINTILANQLVTDVMYTTLLSSGTYTTESITKVVETNPNFPIDQTLIEITDHTPQFTQPQMERLFAVADRPIGHQVYDNVVIKFGLTAADAIFTGLEINNSLSQYCGSVVIYSRTYIETKKEFEYYEANHQGKAEGIAYEVLLGMRDKYDGQSPFPFTVENTDHPGLSFTNFTVSDLDLKHEPSWMLFSVTTSSPHLEGAFNREEYFYNYDLRNRYDRHWYNYDYTNATASFLAQEYTVGNRTQILVENDIWDSYYDVGLYSAPEVPKFDAMSRTQELGNRSLAFQKTTISKNTRDSDPKYFSEYYFYEKGWLVAGYPGDAESNEISVVPCPSPPTMNDPCPVYVDCNECEAVFYKPFMDWEELVPMGYCAWHVPSIGYIICPSGHDPTADFPNETVTQEHCAVYPTTSSSLPYSQTFDDMVHLRSVFVQVDDIDHSTSQEFANSKLDGSNSYIAEFYMAAPNGTNPPAHNMILPSDHLKVREVLERNRFAQVALEENAVGLKTKYHYNRTKYIWNYDPNCPIVNYTSRLNEDIGLPTKVEVGYDLPEVLITEFEHNPIGMVSKVTDPNGKVVDYTFDDYWRLKDITEQTNRLLTEYEYHYWDLNPTSTFDQRTEASYVETKVYNNATANEYEFTKAFVDPLGRNQGNILSYTTDGYNHKNIHSGFVEYDNLGRVISTEKVYTSNSNSATFGAPTLPLVQSFSGAIEQVLFESGYKGRTERISNFGVDLNGIHAIKTKYDIANNIYASCELDLNLNELLLVMRPGGTADVRLFRSEVLDQDDKRTVTYKNAFGQDVATLRYNDNDEKIVTLFAYDSYGNLTKVINPEKQESDYTYNRLGQLVIENTVDAGAKHFMYNKQGLLSIVRDEQGRTKMNGGTRDPFYRVMEYDVFGRMIKQGRSDIAGETHAFLFNNEVFGPLHYKDHFIGASQGNAAVDPITQTLKYFDYTFSDAQTQDYLYSYDYYSSNSIATTVGLAAGEMDIDFREKTIAHGFQQNTYELGRVTQTVSYNEDDKPILANHFQYDAIGNISQQNVEFNDVELWQPTTNPYTIASEIQFSEYNYRGALLQEKIDVDDDGIIDFHLFMDYDPLNRLTAIYGAAGGVTNSSEATLLVSYEYNDVTGKISKREHSVYDTQNSLLAIANEIAYQYDIRDRLVNIESGLASYGIAPMFEYSMFYDDQTVSFNDGTYSSSVSHDNNWNDNINGIEAGYNFNGANITNNVMGFDGPTVYGYDYDAINRMIAADGTVSDLLDVQNLNDSYKIGDVTLTYDRIGNIKSLNRYLRNTDQTQGAPYMIVQGFSYSYVADKNRLLAAVGTNSNTSTRAYTYDIIGNVLTDSYRNIIGTQYGRASYAMELTIDPDGDPQTLNDETVSYLYSSSDQRIYKKYVSSSQTLEDYYLMDASGRTIAILKQGYSNNGWEYYVNGMEREARVMPTSIQQPGSNSGITVAQKRIDKDGATFYVNDHLGNTRITFTPTGFNPSSGTTVYLDDFNSGITGWIVGDGSLSNANQDITVTTNSNATNQLISYNLGSGSLTVGQIYVVSFDADLGNAPALNATVLGSNASNVNINHGTNEIAFMYNGPIAPVLIISVTGGNGQSQQYTYSIDDVFVGQYAGNYANNRIEYVADYFPYGKILREFVESDNERFLTTQHERDSESGLDYRGARYYDSDVARFLSLDPLAANYVAWSPYHYVLGNPITFIDPTGKSSESTGDESTGWTENHVHLNEVFGDTYGFNSTINNEISKSPQWASKAGFVVHQLANMNALLLIYENDGTLTESNVKMMLTQLDKATVYADGPKFQNAWAAYRHAMRRPGQTVNQAKRKADLFVRKRYDWALSHYKNGNYEMAYFTLGVALHALQDATSPAHHGFQLWSGEESHSEEVDHVKQEIWYPGVDSNLNKVTMWFLRSFIAKEELPSGNIFDTIESD